MIVLKLVLFSVRQDIKESALWELNGANLFHTGFSFLLVLQVFLLALVMP